MTVFVCIFDQLNAGLIIKSSNSAHTFDQYYCMCMCLQ